MKWTSPQRWPAWQVHLLLCILTVIASLPIWICHGVPFLDFPNHMARVHILSAYDQVHGYADFYKPQWVILPNLGLDLLLVPLAKFIPIVPLSKLFVTGVFALMVTGFAELRKQLHGSFDPLAFGIPLLLLFNTVTGFGFMNYLMGLGLALWSLALCWRYRDWKWKPLLTTGLGLALFFTHLMGFALFALAWIVLELTSTRRAEYAKRWVGWLGVGISFVIPMIILKLSATASGSSKSYWDFRWWFKAKWLYMALSIGHPIRDTCFEVAIAVALIGFFVFKCVKFDARTWWTGAFFLALFAAAPYQSLTSAFIDARLPIWFFLMLFACLKWRLEAANRSWNIGLVVLMVLGLGRTVDLSLRYISDNVQRDLAAADLSLVPGGSMIFQAAHVWALPLSPETWDPPLLHISCMEAIDRPLYLNNLFTLPQQQPLVDQFWLAPMIRDNYLRVPSQFRLPRVMNEAQTFQRNLFNHDQKSRSLYLFYIKPPYEKPITSAWEVVVDRKRYTLYKSRTNLVNPKSRF